MKHVVFLLVLLYSNHLYSKEYNWRLIDTIPDNLATNYKCSFIKDSNNFIIGGNRNNTYPMTRISTDGGKKWNWGFIDSSFKNFFESKPIAIKKTFWGENNNVICFADSGYYYKSSNLKNWERKQLPIKDVYLVQDANFFNETLIISFSNIVFISRNFGEDWEIIDLKTLFNKNYRVAKLSVINDTIYLACYIKEDGNNFYLLNSTDNGKSWNIVSDLPKICHSLIFINANEGYFYSSSNQENSNYFYYTFNGGKNWELIYDQKISENGITINLNYFSNSLYFLNSNNILFRYSDQMKNLIKDSTILEIGNDLIYTFNHVTNQFKLITNDKNYTYKYTDEEDIGVSVENSQENYITHNSLIFPNPSSYKISLDLGGVEFADLVIYDILGNEVISIPNYTNKSEIDISNLSVGTYTIQVQTSTGSISQRLLVSRSVENG